MSFRYKSRERDRDDRKDRLGFGPSRDRERESDREWDNRDNNWDRGSSNSGGGGDRDYRGGERERYRDHDPSRERDYDRSRDRERIDRNREKSRDNKERDRSYDDRDSFANKDRGDRYRERDKGSNSRYKRNHGFNNVDDDNFLHQNHAKDGYGSDRNSIQRCDWSCYKCGVNNFKRREQCFKCGTPREESAVAIEVGDEISLNPTNCLILRDLAPHITEENILTALEQVTALPIKSIRIPRDPTYSSTRCICFVELHTTLEASQLFNLLCSSNPGFIVDGYSLKVCYAKRNLSSSITPRVSNVASVALAAAQWTNNSEPQQQQPFTTGEFNSHESPSISTSSKPFAANHHHHDLKLTQSKLESIEQNKTVLSLGTVSVNGILYPKYPSPDTSTYQYDENSGYYYDSATGLYYDANSHYYYNPTTQSYLFWDAKHSTYLPVDNKSTTTTTTSSSSSTTSIQSSDHQPSVSSIESNDKNRETKTTNECLEKPKEIQDSGKFGKQDKVMIAKKIAKDMEKWAKTLNQKKENSKLLNQSVPIAFSPEETDNPDQSSSHSQSATYSSKTNDYVAHDEPVKKRRYDYEAAAVVVADSPERPKEDNDPEKPESEDSLSRSPNQSDLLVSLQAQEQKLIDWERLLCLLCKRQFNSKEQLFKHQHASDLHKSNLIKLSESKSGENQYGEAGTSSGDYGYRDRARERRLKYGKPELPDSTVQLSISPPPPVAAPRFAEPQAVTGIGSKLLKAMGWNEGEGLGKMKSKATSIIEVEKRAPGVGIGMKATTTGVGESYKDAVKRASWLRFQELSKNE